MKFIGTLLVFGGYMLVYAAVARGGKFATEPWAGLYEDAYTGDTPQVTPGIPSTIPSGRFTPTPHGLG